MLEKWRKIQGFEGYEISSFGRVKSFKKFSKGLILKGVIGTGGYLQVTLFQESKNHNKKIHQLVAIHFLGHTPCGYEEVVNHKDFNRTNNYINNLELVTVRQNTDKLHLESTSKYTGVSWSHIKNKWASYIWTGSGNLNLGSFDKEEEASQYYQNALIAIKNGESIEVKKEMFSSKYKGVSWCKSKNKWAVYLYINKKSKFIGRYSNEFEAHIKYEEALLKY